jgi:hypothetical protein
VSKTAFTPGPWRTGGSDEWTVDGPGSHSAWHILAKGRKAPIAIVCEPMRGFYGQGDETLTANGKLIAAAPQLYEALAEMVGDHATGGTWRTEAETIAKARAALTAAGRKG